jgi:tagaturonate reductase
MQPQAGLELPGAGIFSLPEKVIQFGTGVLLRGLPDYFIDKANKQGLFNGRVVVVKSTAQGDTQAFAQQEGLYTHCIKGIENGQLVEATIVNAAISKVLSAQEQWAEILDYASQPQVQVIVSNTTEVGISLVNEPVLDVVPASFPGKLLAFLYKRYQYCEGSADGGLVIIPTELISDNGKKLHQIVVELARFNGMDPAFISWISSANDFCSSLVDRIVPGRLAAAEQAALEKQLGYTDQLTIMSECYRLWAIETSSERTRSLLSFSEADSGVVLTPDITRYKELKLRLLNGTHTFSCALAILAGFTTVKEAMRDAAFEQFVSGLMLTEIATAITGDVIAEADAKAFAAQVIDRFRNPHIEHLWTSITMQYTSKMAMRNVPLINWFYEKYAAVPRHMALGFAAYLLLLHTTKNAEGTYTAKAGGKTFALTDDKAGVLYKKWQQAGGAELVQQALSDVTLWGSDLAALPGFADAVSSYLQALTSGPVTAVISELQKAQPV